MTCALLDIGSGNVLDGLLFYLLRDAALIFFNLLLRETEKRFSIRYSLCIICSWSITWSSNSTLILIAVSAFRPSGNLLPISASGISVFVFGFSGSWLRIFLFSFVERCKRRSPRVNFHLISIALIVPDCHIKSPSPVRLLPSSSIVLKASSLSTAASTFEKQGSSCRSTPPSQTGSWRCRGLPTWPRCPCRS